MKSMEGKKVLVIGLADSGYESATAACELGADVTVIDSSEHPVGEGAAGELAGLGINVELGIEVPGGLDGYDLVITSPGVPDHAPVILEARRLNQRIISELEFGYQLLDNRMAAVTGTNGKTTTTRLISWIMNSPGRRAFPCGNIGKPLVSLYGQVGAEDLLIVEVSSFQLRNIEEFRADVSVILNVAPDHFDWHSDFDDYKRSKMRLVENMRESDYLVYNADDRFCRDVVEAAGGLVIGFSLVECGKKGIWVEDGWVVAGEPFNAGRLVPVEEIKLRGVHNLANVCAAVGAALCLEEKPQRIREAVGSFKSLEHRMEFAGEIDGVKFFNDSKATNPHAAIHSVKSFGGPLVVIMGGRNKGLDFKELAGEITRRMGTGSVIGVVLFGESVPEMRAAMAVAGLADNEGRVVTASGMEDSVRRAFQMAAGGGTVLFSPACASFDMYSNYRERGKAFKESVRSIEGRG